MASNSWENVVGLGEEVGVGATVTAERVDARGVVRHAPCSPATFVGMTACYLAIDVGSEKLAAAIVGERAEVLVRDRVATPQRDVWAALARLAKRVLAAAPSAPVACGVGCVGPINPVERTVSPLHIPSLEGFALAAEFEAMLGLPAIVDSNAKTIAMAEAWCGAGVGLTDFVAVVMGPTVAGGVVSGGKLLEGRLGNAGNLGHIVVEADGRPCVCGGKGCLDAYAGGKAIEEETGRPPQRAPQSIIERTGIHVGRALLSLGAICDLRTAILGGPVALGFGEPLFAAIQAELDARSRLMFSSGFQLLPSGLGESGPLVGAAALARSLG